MTTKDAQLVKVLSECTEYGISDPKVAEMGYALADRMKKSEPVACDCVWEPCNTESSFSSATEYVFECQRDWKVGDVFNLVEAYYFDAEFRIVSIPDLGSDDDWVTERVSGSKLYTHPVPASAPNVGEVEPDYWVGHDTHPDYPVFPCTSIEPSEEEKKAYSYEPVWLNPQPNQQARISELEAQRDELFLHLTILLIGGEFATWWQQESMPWAAMKEVNEAEAAITKVKDKA